MSREWYQMKSNLEDLSLKGPANKNQFFQRLISVLNESEPMPGDIFGAYRDALMACAQTSVIDKHLPLLRIEIGEYDISSFGLRINSVSNLELDTDVKLNAIDGPIDLNKIYDETPKSKIAQFPIDPALGLVLKDQKYQSYNGRAQQMAVRLSLLSKPNSTTIINLPTGTGKTLVSHALCLFSPQGSLTLVVVPTTALAIDQAHRAKKMLEKAGLDNAANYYWSSDQTHSEHLDIKRRILEGQQRILFVSPEAACMSLVMILFEVARVDMLENIILDEAHMVDEWGADFRPYYQIFAVIVASLRKESKKGINCFLMSATFTTKSIDTLKGLFLAPNKDAVEIHGGFLRSEIQYSLQRSTSVDYDNAVINAVKLLPKPLIVYVISPKEAEALASRLRQADFGRVASFTGRTNHERRTSLLKKWGNEEIDIMVGTSAFGMGVDKGNVRAILHAGVPPNMDSFYQQVGRGGRDGRCCQSLIIYYPNQMEVARKINTNILIGFEKGFGRWKAMWDFGVSSADYDRTLNLQAQHEGIQKLSRANEMWNWRTLLLMQRANMIRLTIESPQPPDWDGSRSESENRDARDEYFQKYYSTVKVNTLKDIHDEAGWTNEFKLQRDEESHLTQKAFHTIWKWIEHCEFVPLCSELKKFYTLPDFHPEKRCGGCPHCRTSGYESDSIPETGHLCSVFGLENNYNWSGVLEHQNRYVGLYYSSEGLSSKFSRIIRNWTLNWINPLIKSQAILAIRSDENTLKKIAKNIHQSNRGFWIGIPTGDQTISEIEWAELVLVMPHETSLPDLQARFIPRLLVAPKTIPEANGSGHRWWELNDNVSDLDNFFQGIF